jgi:predicted anti-sigma-YlaC factor YlaD
MKNQQLAVSQTNLPQDALEGISAEAQRRRKKKDQRGAVTKVTRTVQNLLVSTNNLDRWF